MSCFLSVKIKGFERLGTKFKYNKNISEFLLDVINSSVFGLYKGTKESEKYNFLFKNEIDEKSIT